MRIKIKLICILLAIVGVAACAGMQIKSPVTDLQRYEQELKWWNGQMANYWKAYDKADPALQKAFTKQVEPLFQEALDALRIWKAHMEVDTCYGKEQEYMAVKMDLYASLKNHGIIQGR